MLGNVFLGHTKRMNHKRKIAKLDFIKIKTYAACEPLFRKWEDKSQTGRRYLQNTNMIENLYSEYIKNPPNSTEIRETAT